MNHRANKVSFRSGSRSGKSNGRGKKKKVFK